MSRLTLPRGRWRYLLGGALVFTAFVSQSVVTKVFALFDAFGSAVPVSVQVAASPLWVAGCIALAMVGILAAAVLGQRRYAGAWVLVCTTLLLLASAVFTTWSALRGTCHPLGAICCMGPIS